VLQFTKPERANILTSPENETWRVVRRAAVAALTMSNLRLSFPHITAVTQRLIDSLAAAGPEAVHDMDAAAAAITVDVIGLAAFNRDLQATCPPIPGCTIGAARRAGPHGSDAGSAAAAPQQGSKAAAAPAPAAAAAGGEQPQLRAPAIGGSVLFPRGRDVLGVINRLVVAMQARNNPLNRWFPWRKVRGALGVGLVGVETVWTAPQRTRLGCVTQSRAARHTRCLCTPCVCLRMCVCVQDARDLMLYGGKMADIVRALAASMDAVPPPPHTLGAHLLAATYSDGGCAHLACSAPHTSRVCTVHTVAASYTAGAVAGTAAVLHPRARCIS
jgi:hypothetical protein